MEEKTMSTTAIIDLYYNESIDLKKLKDEGIVAIIHKATEGGTFKDPEYAKRKKAAKDAGFLWGAYHFATSADVEQQVDFFLNTVQPAPDDLVAFDWEAPKHGTPMTIAHVRDSVELIHHKLGRYPLLYGGHVLREAVGNSHDLVLKNCPLWYARYNSIPLGIPKNTWPTYTLWQYTAGEIHNPHNPPPGPLQAGGKFIDRNMYQGTKEELVVKWPLT
jgi:lysozyme